MTITDAQEQIRRAYIGGAPGVLVSGLVWLVAAIVDQQSGTRAGFAALFVGGMLIFPLSTLIVTVVFRHKIAVSGNGLTGIALESTIAMIGGLLAAWLLLMNGADAMVMPVAAIAVGTHYFVFKTLYGDRTYWVLAAAITVAGTIGLFAPILLPMGVTYAVAAIELAVGAWLLRRSLAAR